MVMERLLLTQPSYVLSLLPDHQRDAGGSNPLVRYYPQRRWVPHTQEIDVFFVILNGQQHSAHFSKEEADSVAFDLSVEHNYEGHPEECGYSKISVLSFMEMMESPVEMVL